MGQEVEAVRISGCYTDFESSDPKGRDTNWIQISRWGRRKVGWEVRFRRPLLGRFSKTNMGKTLATSTSARKKEVLTLSQYGSLMNPRITLVHESISLERPPYIVGNTWDDVHLPRPT